MPFISKRKNNLGNQKRSYRRPRKIHVNNSKKNMFGGVSSTTEDNNEDKVNAIANELKELYNRNEDLINKANSLGGNLSEDDIRELQNIITFYEEKSKEYEAINESLGLFPNITDKDTFDNSVEYITKEFQLIIERLKENLDEEPTINTSNNSLSNSEKADLIRKINNIDRKLKDNDDKILELYEKDNLTSSTKAEAEQLIIESEELLQQLENITEAEVNKLDNAAVKATYDGLKVEYLIEAYKTHITELKTKTGQSPVNSPVNSSTNNLGRSISNSETPEDIILNVYTVIILTNGTRIDEYIQKGKEGELNDEDKTAIAELIRMIEEQMQIFEEAKARLDGSNIKNQAEHDERLANLEEIPDKLDELKSFLRDNNSNTNSNDPLTTDMNQHLVTMNENEEELETEFLIDRNLTLDEVKEARRIIDETEASLKAFRQIKTEALNAETLQRYQNTVELGRLDSVEETIRKVNTKIVEALDSSGELTQEHIMILMNYIEKNCDKMDKLIDSLDALNKQEIKIAKELIEENDRLIGILKKQDMEMEIEPPPKSEDSNESSPLSPDSNMPLRDLIERISEITDPMREKLVEKIRTSSDIPSNNLSPKDNSSTNNLGVKPPDNGLPRPNVPAITSGQLSREDIMILIMNLQTNYHSMQELVDDRGILTKPETKFAEDLIDECDRLMEQLKEQKIDDDDDSPNQLLTLGQMKEKILDLAHPMREKLFEKIRVRLESISNSSTPHSSISGHSSESNNNEETKTQVLTLLLELANKNMIMMDLNEELVDKSNRNIMITKEEIQRAETLVDETNDLIEKIEAVKLQKNQDIINIKERRINGAVEATQELMNFIKFQSLDNSSTSNSITGGPIPTGSNNESSTNNLGTAPTSQDASDIDELLKSCEDLKTNYEHKHEEVLLLGEIITALKDQFQKLGDNSSTNDDCEEIKAELEALKKILGPDLKDKIKEKISSINDLLTKLPEAQKAVMAQAQQNIKGILNNKTFSNRFDALNPTSNNNDTSSPSLPFPKQSAPVTKVRNNGKIAETVLGKKSKKSGKSDKIRIVRSKKK